MVKFYDTSTLLDLREKAFDTEEKFYISMATLVELENIKSSNTKDNEIKYAARDLLRNLYENEDKYEIVVCDNSVYDNIINQFNIPINNDSRIIAAALAAKDSGKEIKFYTSDLACYKIAQGVGLDAVYSRKEEKDSYTGFLEIEMTEPGLAAFYSDTLPNNYNVFNLLTNQYLLLKFNNKIVDKYKWTKNGYVKVNYSTLNSYMFGQIKPYNEDVYQMCALDSLASNQVTVMRGKAGSGKSYLGLGSLMSLLDKGKIDKIIIFCNTVAVRGAARLGFYPGSRDEKLLDSQIGNFLASKFGSIIEVEKMIDEGQLMLLPCSDIRGFDTTGMRAGIYITEGQNTSVDMLKLMLQRIGEDSIVVVEGDDEAQVDMNEYSGSNNGLHRMSQVFRGQDFYGEVTLQTIYRSKIAAIADNM